MSRPTFNSLTDADTAFSNPWWSRPAKSCRASDPQGLQPDEMGAVHQFPIS